MNYLFFTNTPAHVHLYKHSVEELVNQGHDVVILARDYGCTIELLDYHNLPYRIYGDLAMNQMSLIRKLPMHFARILRFARRYDPDVIFGMGVYAAITGAALRTPVIIVVDSEPDVIDHAISTRLVTLMLTPHSFQKNLGPKQYQFNGFKECAYLHPEIYQPSCNVRNELGLKPNERFVILRFNAFGSHHDLAQFGISLEQRRELIESLSKHATVLVSDESDEMDFHGIDARPFDIHPARIHDALSEASLLVADTQTMVTEAALLATPAIRSNSYVGKTDMGNFRELERNGLILNIREFDEVLRVSEELLMNDGIHQMEGQRDRYMKDKINLTNLIVDIAVSYDSVTQTEELAQVLELGHTG